MNTRKKTTVFRRRGQRGAALLETVIVVPTFIILFLSMIFMHDTILQKLKTMSDARTRTWTAAMASCTGDGADVPQPGFTSTLDGSDQGGALQDKTGTSIASAEATVHVGTGPSVLFSSAVSSKISVLCNNQTEPGDIASVFRWIIHNVQYGI